MGKLDINVGKLKKNAFRYSKVRGETAARIRIPGGVIDADSLAKVVEIAEKYGQGVIDLTNRQGIEIPGIKMEDSYQSERTRKRISILRNKKY